MATWTNNGLIIAAASGVQQSITYVSISPGCGSLAAPIAAGTPITTLTLNAPGLPAALSNGQTLTVTDGVNAETVTVSGTPGSGATSITISSWTPAHAYAANTAGVVPAQLASDVTLYGESVRVAANPGGPGAQPGETLNTGYFDGTQATTLFMSVGYWGGAATSALGSGTLMIEDIQVWAHVVNSDTNMYQADTTI